MRFCLIGCGNIASTMHAPAYRAYQSAHPDFYPAACCDVMESRAVEMQKQVGFARHYTDYRQMLAKEKPDAVAVIVSETAAVEVGLDVLRAGIPMLIEKPPGRTSEGTAALAAEAQKRGVPCQVAFNRRYMPVLSAMRARAPEKIHLISYELIRYARKDPYFSNTTVHAIDAVRYLANADYAHVRFSYLEMPQHGEGVCDIFMDCTMTSGTKAQIRLCQMAGVSLERAGIYAENQLLLGYTPVWGGVDAPGAWRISAMALRPPFSPLNPAKCSAAMVFCRKTRRFSARWRRGKNPRRTLPRRSIRCW